MQRKSIRATVGADDIDIPIHSFLPNQTLVYEGDAIITGVRVKVVGTPTTGNLASWFNAETIQDSGLLVADIVHNPGTSVTRQIAVFSDTTGKAIAAAPVKVDVAGAMTLVTDINGRPVDSFVTGPVSASDSFVALYNGTTGKALKNSTIDGTQIVTAGVAPIINQVAVFTGVGIAIKNVTVTIIGGALTNVTTINTIDPATWVVGPASAGANKLASFNGTTGKLIKDSGLDSTQVVTSGAAATANQVAVFTGTGVAIVNVTVTIVGGAITSVATINAIDPATWVVGPASSTTNNVASYNGTTGKLIKDSGVLATNLVTTVLSPTANQVATFSGTGKAIVNQTVEISGGAITNITSIGGETFSNFIVAPFAVTSNNLVSFAASGVTKRISDTGINATLIATRTISAAARKVAVWRGTTTVDGGLEDAPVTITTGGAIAGVTTLNTLAISAGGAITGASTINTVAISAGGAISSVTTLNGITVNDIMFTDGSGTFDGNDMAIYTSSGFIPKQTTSDILGAQVVSTTSVEPSPWRFIATRAGDFSMTWDFCITLGDTSSSVEVKVFWTSGTGKAFCTFEAAGTLTFTTSGTASSFVLTGTTPPVMGCRCVLTVTGASANCNVYMMFRKTGGVSYSILGGGLGTMREKD